MSTLIHEHVRRLWRELADAPGGFDGSGGLLVVGSDAQQAAPDGWVGIVELLRDVVVVCPLEQHWQVSRLVRHDVADRLVGSGLLSAKEWLEPARTLGPGLLFYGTPAPAIWANGGNVIGPLAIDDHRVQAVLDDATQDERNESSIEATTSGVYVALAGNGAPGAACAWRVWPHGVAHISALTAARYRGRGLGTAAAVAALDAAGRLGLLPQWRVSMWNHASIALAERLGLTLTGRQYSVLLDDEG